MSNKYSDWAVPLENLTQEQANTLLSYTPYDCYLVEGSEDCIGLYMNDLDYWYLEGFRDIITFEEAIERLEELRREGIHV